jgi:hypothetical protein
MKISNNNELCYTQTLKDHGLLTERVAFSGDNTNKDFGGIN